MAWARVTSGVFRSGVESVMVRLHNRIQKKKHRKATLTDDNKCKPGEHAPVSVGLPAEHEGHQTHVQQDGVKKLKLKVRYKYVASIPRGCIKIFCRSSCSVCMLATDTGG